jgi:PTH2 family peptidyl-tRNA hydrolase
MIKQVIIIRKDLKMRRGKEITQGSHASGYFYKENEGKPFDMETKSWIQTGETKITCVVNSEEELEELHEKAKEMGLRSHLITDAGRTEFNGVPTKTCLAIGPNRASDVDEITGNLKLY